MDMSANHSTSTSVKETFTSILIALVLAFVFRGFVIEAFVIPTGSMAPTLRGQFIRVHSDETGANWAAGPRDYRGMEPLRLQGAQGRSINLRDPMTMQPVDPIVNAPLLGGDRIFVLKYLYPLYAPSRFDVVVFKNPNDPTQNYIKRLIGLPGEQLAMVDGDIFTRAASASESTIDFNDTEGRPWTLDGWTIARKSEQAQDEMWQPVFRSDYAPLNPTRDGRKWNAPWVGGADWTIEGRQSYEFTGSGPTSLRWDSRNRPIDDYYSYNEAHESIMGGPRVRFPVGDVRVSFGVKAANMTTFAPGFLIKTRGHEFRARLIPSEKSAEFAMRADGANEWTVISRVDGLPPAPSDAIHNFEFIHVDQELRIVRDGVTLARATYEWNPAQRLLASTGIEVAELVKDKNSNTLLANPSNYRSTEVSIEFDGGAFSLYRVGLDRDIFYRPDIYRSGNEGRTHTRYDTPSAGSHPFSTLALSDAEYFFCGDNSPASLDGRLWDVPSPYVMPLDPKIGVVHRDMIIGRAFFVYFPAMERKFVPNFGMMRWIR